MNYDNSDDDSWYENSEDEYSEAEEDEDNEDNETMINSTRFNIILCELYNEHVHGKTNSEVINHYLILIKYKKFDLSNIQKYARYFNSEGCKKNRKRFPHPIIRNYVQIVNNRNYIKPEIGKCIYLNTNESVVILKTFWLRLIQRTWKTIFKKRQLIFRKRCSIQSLRYRELHGRWPEDCIYPSIYGMLRYLW
jgi:hypothetical protein